MERFLLYRLVATFLLINATTAHPVQESETTDAELDFSTTVINNETLILVNCSRYSDKDIHQICEDCYTFQYECPYGEIDNNNITCSRSSGWKSCATCSICDDLPSLYPTHDPDSESTSTTGTINNEAPIRSKRQAGCIPINGACGSGTPCCAAQGLKCQSTSAGRGNRRKTCRYA